MSATADNTGADRAVDERAAALEDLIANLWLYVGRRTWTQLTTSQKELFADVVDAHHAAADIEEGYQGTEFAFTPVQRWWRTSATAPTNEPVAAAGTHSTAHAEGTAR